MPGRSKSRSQTKCSPWYNRLLQGMEPMTLPWKIHCYKTSRADRTNHTKVLDRISGGSQDLHWLVAPEEEKSGPWPYFCVFFMWGTLSGRGWSAVYNYCWASGHSTPPSLNNTKVTLMCDGQLANLIWCQAPIWGPWQISHCHHTVVGLLMRSILSNKTKGLQFTVPASLAPHIKVIQPMVSPPVCPGIRPHNQFCFLFHGNYLLFATSQLAGGGRFLYLCPPDTGLSNSISRHWVCQSNFHVTIYIYIYADTKYMPGFFQARNVTDN
jgi:hypothetical protein